MRSLLYTQKMEPSSALVSGKQNLSSSRLWDWKAAFLVLVLLQVSSLRLVVTEWAPFLYFTQTMGFVGLVLGLVLGYSNFSRQAVIRLAAGYTFILIPAQLLSAVEKTGWLWQDILALLERLFFSLEQFIRNKPVHDSLFFVSVVTLIYWFIGLAAGYWLNRHRNFLNVVLPSGMAILTIQAFDPIQTKHIWYLAFFTFEALLLLGRMYFLENRSFWNKSRFLLTDEAVSDLEREALVITAVAVFIAWSMPGLVSSIKPVANSWREFAQPIYDRFANAVSALESPYTVGDNGEFYGRSLFLGEQAAAGENTIFTVQLREKDLLPVRSYWKGRNYDLYFDGRWTMAEDQSEPFNPTADALGVEYPQNRSEVTLTFTNSAKKQNLLYAPAETIWISKNATLHYAASISEKVKDTMAWITVESLSSGNQYKARALMSDPTVEELRSAGTEYPAWVRERYLQVPEEITPQLKELAQEITASQETVFDKAQTITTYLRTEIEYQKTIDETLPKDRDPVLWVLFNYKKGFCMYYASAETLMLRSIGIPSRMAVGFAEGDYDEAEGKYTVSYEDSHAWPEVYFPGIGWVEFEPTSNQTSIERPETESNADSSRPEASLAENLASTPQRPNALEDRLELLDEELGDSSAVNRNNLYRRFLVPALIVIMFGLGIYLIRRYSLNDRLPVYLAFQYERRGNVPPRWLKRWVRWTTFSAIERAFQSVNLSLFWLGQSQPAHITSQERTEILIKRLPSAQDQALSLLQEYHNAIYTPRDGNVAIARKAAAFILLKTWQTRIKETLQSADNRYNQLK